MTNPNHIEAAWQGYFRKVLPDNASEIQIVETKRAFFAGAFAFFQITMTNLEPGLTETPLDIHLMENLTQEIKTFCEDVKTGKQ